MLITSAESATLWHQAAYFSAVSGHWFQPRSLKRRPMSEDRGTLRSSRPSLGVETGLYR